MFKKPSLTKDYTHVWSEDPAIDTESEDFDHDQWIATGDDKYLPLKNGGKPVEFVLRHLDEDERALVVGFQDKRGELAGATMLVRLGVKSFKNMRAEGGEDIKSVRSMHPRYDEIALNDSSYKAIRLAGDTLFGELLTRISNATFGDPT